VVEVEGGREKNDSVDATSWDGDGAEGKKKNIDGRERLPG
jgi:hypothetical protein